MRKRYPKYKPTIIPWLKEVPEEWDEVKVKFLFRERVEKGYENEPLLAATQTQGVVPKELYENRTVTAQKDFHLLKLVEKGDFVISLRSFQGGIEYAHYRGIISPAYTIMRPGLLVEKGYFRHLFKSKYFIDDLATNVTGIREGQNIDYAEFRDSFQPLPPLPDQRAIAAFLDHKCALIDTFIQKKTRLIELLKEQKQALINRAVTRGLDPEAPLKPSGIEWLGDIPEEWEVKKLRWVCKMIRDGTHNPPQRTSSGFRLLSVRNIIDDTLCLRDDDSLISNDDFNNFKKSFEPLEGDVLLAIVGGTIGKTAMVPKMEQFAIQRSLAIFRPFIEIVNSMFLWRFFQSPIFQRLLWNNVGYSAQPGIYLGALGDFRIAIPPIEEQKDIIEFIELEFALIDKTISRITREIDLIKEYKSALIAEAVTGGIDVRGWRNKDEAG